MNAKYHNIALKEMTIIMSQNLQIIHLKYRKWDESIWEIKLQLCEKTSVYQVVEAVPISWDYEQGKQLPSYANLEYNNDDTIHLKCHNQEDQEIVYKIKASTFYEKVEGVGTKAIVINTIADYIEIIDSYRFVALLVKIQRILDDGLCQCRYEASDDAAKRAAQSNWQTYWGGLSELAVHLEEEAMNRVRATIGQPSVQIQKMDDLEKELKNEVCRSIEDAKKCNETVYHAHPQIREIATLIDNAVTRYNEDNVFLHYRGVGRIIYPEYPGVFRGKRKYDEDRLYKEMKIAFPQELSNLRYLDRLAKCQHFELPTRMLDVTSNPLVALYMACNTIYTGDKEQKDYGEVIIYFSGNQKERAYDSKALLTVAALVKLTYREKTDMYKFIRMHQQHINGTTSPNKRGVKHISMWKLLNHCIHVASDKGCDFVFPEHEQEYLMDLMKKAGRNANPEQRTPFGFAWACMNEIKKPKNDSNWRCVNVNAKQHFCVSVSKEEYRRVFERFISAYDHLLVTVRRENPAFQNKIDVATLLESYHGRFGMTNERILAQAGSFIIAGLDHRYINDFMLSTRTKVSAKEDGLTVPSKEERFVRIIICNKKKLFKQLNLLNFSNATMLPDMSHKAGDLKEPLDRKWNIDGR